MFINRKLKELGYILPKYLDYNYLKYLVDIGCKPIVKIYYSKSLNIPRYVILNNKELYPMDVKIEKVQKLNKWDIKHCLRVLIFIKETPEFYHPFSVGCTQILINCYDLQKYLLRHEISIYKFIDKNIIFENVNK